MWTMYDVATKGVRMMMRGKDDDDDVAIDAKVIGRRVEIGVEWNGREKSQTDPRNRNLARSTWPPSHSAIAFLMSQMPRSDHETRGSTV
jgi:hypothetical protein